MLHSTRLIVRLFPLIVLAAAWTPSAANAQSACIDQQMACNETCDPLDTADAVRCLCQCFYDACICAAGGTQFEGICLETSAAICGNDLTGLTQSDPLLPTATFPGGFEFEGALSGMWCDPPFTDGFEYSMTGASLFTAIIDFPTGFAQPFTVSVGEQTLGSFGPGEAVSFATFPNGGVSSFTVSGISPEVDTEDPEAFPIRLAYNTTLADFRMTSVPEPGATALGGAALATLLVLSRRRR